MDKTYAQSPGSTTRIVDGEAFIITAQKIHHLNAVATVIWIIIEQPAPQDEIVQALQRVFPSVDAATIQRDSRATLEKFVKDKLAHTQLPNC
jgi:hypothetical protein